VGQGRLRAGAGRTADHRLRGALDDEEQPGPRGAGPPRAGAGAGGGGVVAPGGGDGLSTALEELAEAAERAQVRAAGRVVGDLCV
jgi:hypothetical protein